MSTSSRNRRDNGGSRTEPVVGDLDEMNAAARFPRHRETSRKRRPGPAPRRHSPVGWLLGIALVLLGVLLWSARDELRSWLPSTELNQLLERGDLALADERLNGAQGNSARELYSAALALAPDSERARQGLQEVGEAQFVRAQQALASDHLQAATHALDEARVLLGGGAELDALARQIADARGRNTEIAILIERADAALAEDRVHGGGGAAALYGQVLEADPDNAVAAHGMQKVGAVYAARIRASLQADDLPHARDELRQLSALLPDHGELPGLRAAVAQAERVAKATLQRSLKEAAADLQAGRLTGAGENNALARYRKILEADPDNTAAAEGIDRVASALLLRARAATEAGSFGEARDLIETAAGLRPDSPALAAARSRLQQARTLDATSPIAADSGDDTSAPPPSPSPAQQARVRKLVLRAQAAASAGDLMLPPGESAYDLYRAALAIDPESTDALAGLADLPGQARRLFDAAIEADELQAAAELLMTFSDLLPGSSSIVRMQDRLGSAWLDQAATLADAGNVGSARHALSEARRWIPDDARVAAMAKRLGH